MSELLDRPLDGTEQELPREPYSPPRLVRHGTIEDLTRGNIPAAVGDPSSLAP